MNRQEIVDAHIEKALANIRVFFVEASKRIEAVKVGETISSTGLVQSLAKEASVDLDKEICAGTLYPVMMQMFKNYPSVTCKTGKGGGLKRWSEEDFEVEMKKQSEKQSKRKK